MLPARKNLITANGSMFPAASLTVKILVSVFRHGSSMNPKNRYAKHRKPISWKALSVLNGFGCFNLEAVILRPP
jgi:hypothetical protein